MQDLLRMIHCLSTKNLSQLHVQLQDVLTSGVCYRYLGPSTLFLYFVLPTIPLPMGHDNQQQRDLLRDLGPVCRW